MVNLCCIKKRIQGVFYRVKSKPPSWERRGREESKKKEGGKGARGRRGKGGELGTSHPREKVLSDNFLAKKKYLLVL